LVWHAPPASHVSGLSQTVSASLPHGVPDGSKPSAGQLGSNPVHCSAASQLPTEGRQTVDEGERASAGHVVLVPVHASATSQSPAAERHTVPACPAGCWHRALEPSHWSSVQMLASAVQAVPLVFLSSAGQVCPATPVHASVMSHSPAAARQSVPPGATTSAGQVVFDPSQLSLGSHASPEPLRQTNVLGRTESAGHAALLPEQASATSHAPVAARHTVADDLKEQLAEQQDPAVPFVAP